MILLPILLSMLGDALRQTCQGCGYPILDSAVWMRWQKCTYWAGNRSGYPPWHLSHSGCVQKSWDCMLRVNWHLTFWGGRKLQKNALWLQSSLAASQNCCHDLNMLGSIFLPFEAFLSPVEFLATDYAKKSLLKHFLVWRYLGENTVQSTHAAEFPGDCTALMTWSIPGQHLQRKPRKPSLCLRQVCLCRKRKPRELQLNQESSGEKQIPAEDRQSSQLSASYL